ncbi:MAG: hypothetical protein REI11_14695 [Patulibacter sp.]|nr:hypothetical protein [Patulibacter sp.]
MSAFVVDVAHIDVLVRVALAGPSDGSHRGRRGRGPFPLRWWVPVPGEVEPSTLDRALEVFTGEPPVEPRMVPKFLERRLRAPGHTDPLGVTPDELGSMWLGENVRSVMHLYPDTVDGGELPGTGSQWREPYRFTDPEYTLTCAQASAAILGYAGQACEHPDHHASEAFFALQALSEAVLRVLPGIDDAPHHWGPQQLHQARCTARMGTN